MRITTSSGSTVTSGTARSASAPGSGRFEIGGDASAANAPSKTIATIGLSAVLALQDEGETPSERRRRQLRRGVRILDALEALERDMVLGRLGEMSFSQLSGALSMVSPRDLDTEGRQILRAIDVRAAVELAKVGR
ncbi:MAG: flagellar assembly protein FliX [Alphaproteobacteria bacterium]